VSVASGPFYPLYRRLPFPLQDFLVTAAGAPRWAHEASPRFQGLVSFLCRAEGWDPAEAGAYRTSRLRRVLEAASLTRRYSRLIPRREILERDPWGVLASLPPLGKEEVRSDPSAFLNPRFRGRVHRHGTSGTTGTPLQVFWTRSSMDMERALIWRHRLRAGCRIGKDWRGMLGGLPVVPVKASRKPWWRVNALARQVYLSTYHISPGNAPDYAECLDSFGLAFLEGYPSVLSAAALVMAEAGLGRNLAGVFFGAEPMNAIQRDLVESAFGCHAWDFYGLTERVASASEFECRSLHVNWENCVLELVREDGRPAEPGEHAEIVGTSLSNLAFPLLRYGTGDMSSLLEGGCSCGRRSPRIAAVDTKREDLLVMPDGSLLSASNLTYPFKEVGNIRESQICQPSLREVVVRLVPDGAYREEDGLRLKEGLESLIGRGVDVRLEIVDGIPRGPAGKYAFCVSVPAKDLARRGAAVTNGARRHPG